MSFKEIKELRQAGKLEEALLLANQALESGPEDIWNKRAAAWVYYDYLKKYSNPESFDLFKENLVKINDLQLPADEHMVFDNSAWQIGSLIFALQKEEPVPYGKIDQLHTIIMEFPISRPSEAFSFLYKAFHKGYQNWNNYLQFADWWNFENFRPQDFLEEEFQGKKIMAMVEQAYIAYSKKLLETGKPIIDTIQKIASIHQQVDLEKIEEFLPKLDQLIDEHPEYQYPPYFKAKLLIAVGSEKNALTAFLPFAKQKRNDFWVWQLMAEIFSEDREIQFACYCKALNLNTPEDYLVKIRQIFASLLVDKQLYVEAKTEIEKIIATRSRHEWKLPNQVAQWTEQDWYKEATAKQDNKDLYLKNERKAEQILYQDIPEDVVVVEFVNENKGILNFVKNKDKHGFFNYSRQIDSVQIGDILKVRFNGEGQEGFFKILTAEKAEPTVTSEAIKNFEGQLKVITPQNFGFVEDVFIEPKLIEESSLANGQTLKGKAILSFNKKKQEWGWKAILLVLD